MTSVFLSAAPTVLIALAIAGRYFDKVPTALCLLLVLGLSVYQIVKNPPSLRQVFIKNKTLIVLVGLTLAAWCTAAILGRSPDEALAKWASISALIGCGFLIRPVFTPTARQYFLAYFPSLLAWFMGVIGLYCFFDQTGFLSDWGWPQAQKEPFFSTFVAMALPFMGMAFHDSPTARHTRVAYLCLFIGGVALAVCDGRSGWLAALVALIFLMSVGIMQKNLLQSIAHKITRLVVLTIGVMVGLLSAYASRDSAYFLDRLTLSEGAGAGTGRLEIWAFSWDKFLENPIVGIGFKGYRSLDFSGLSLSSDMHPHNAVIELLLETGLIGFMAFAILIVYVMAQGLRSYRLSSSPREKAMLTALAASLIAYGTASLTMTSFFHAWWFVYGVLMVVLVYLMRHHNKH